MSIFAGQYGSFGGGYLTGQGGQSQTPSMQFGGGFLQAPQGMPGPVAAEIKASVEVVYALDPTSLKPRDRSGRRAPYERKSGWPFEMGPQGGVHRQKRY